MTAHSGKAATRRSKIAGLGLSLPSRVLTNADLEKMVDTSDEWITARTGIKERRIAEDGVTASQLGIPAALEALDAAGVEPKDVGLIICATSTPDRIFPSTSCAIQRGIGAGECASFDLLAACSGFIYSLSVADQFIRAGTAKTALVVASEVYSKIINWKDRTTCVLFGDGAAAAVLKATSGASGLIDSKIHSNGAFGDLLQAVALGSGRPEADALETAGGYFLEMKGNQTFKVAVKTMTDVTGELLEKNGYTIDDVDIIIPHQANIRILKAVGKSLGVSEDKVFINVDRYGNTSAASIPIAMYEAAAAGKLKKGSLALLVAFGGGLTWGASLIRW